MLNEIIKLALQEDIGMGDITSENIFSKKDSCTAIIKAKENMIVCGLDIAKEIFNYIDGDIIFKSKYKDGDKVKAGDILAQAKGKTLAILKAERTVLNFMQRLSGIASLANEYANLSKKYGVRICDTRKSLPGMRRLDKYAVLSGGAFNHRMNLSDAVMIKDNHIKAAGGIKKAVDKIKKRVSHTIKIEVETKNLQEIKQALNAGVDIIMLDNMTPAQIKQAKKIIGDKAIIEVSGGINKENIKQYLETKPDVISIGELTHSVKAKDISMEII